MASAKMAMLIARLAAANQHGGGWPAG